MSRVANGHTMPAAIPPSSQADFISASHRSIGPIFLMINSLETGGSERQFVELARCLRADQLEVHLGCVQKKGAFLEGLGDLHEFRLGGSLFGRKSMQSRWRLMRCLRALNIAVAHAFDFYANLTLIPAARLAGVPLVIGRAATVAGTGFPPSTRRAVVVVQAGSVHALGEVAVDAQGAFQLQGVVPSNLAPGPAQLRACVPAAQLTDCVDTTVQLSK